MSDQKKTNQSEDQEPSKISTSGENTIYKKSQTYATLYYDTADSFLLDIGNELEQAISPLLSVQSQKILGGASPLFPIIEFVIKYGPEATVYAAGAAGVFFSSTLKKLGENFADRLANKFTRKKNDKSVQLTITLISDKTTINASIIFDDYKTIADAMKATQRIINDAYEKQSRNLDRIPQGLPISYRDKGTRIISRSNFQFRYKYDTASKIWILESIHELN